MMRKKIILAFFIFILLCIGYVSMERYADSTGFLKIIVGNENTQYLQLVEEKDFEGIDGGEKITIYKIKNNQHINCELLNRFKNDKLIPLYELGKKYMNKESLLCSKIVKYKTQKPIYVFLSKKFLIIKRFY